MWVLDARDATEQDLLSVLGVVVKIRYLSPNSETPHHPFQKSLRPQIYAPQHSQRGHCSCNVQSQELLHFVVIIYTCVILDLFSRKVVAYKISKKNSTQLITSTFKMAWEQRSPKAGLIFHSDRGSQYTSHRFQQLLRECSVIQSFSSSGKPHDNAVAESFFATFKKEELYRKDYTSETDFKRGVDSYIQFYNCQRPHRTLRNQTPCQAEEKALNCKA